MEEVCAHYYSLVPGKKCIDKEHYAAMQKARKTWADVQKLERGPEEAGYDREEMLLWLKEAKLPDLEYKQFNGVASHTGFFSKTSADHLLLAVYEHFALQELDANDILGVDSTYKKVRFTISQPMEELPPDEDSEGEDEEAPAV